MRRVWIRASERYRAIVLRISRDLKQKNHMVTVLPFLHLSSLPTMQVETRRQHESGQGMVEY